jgi:hypothetical protein
MIWLQRSATPNCVLQRYSSCHAQLPRPTDMIARQQDNLKQHIRNWQFVLLSQIVQFKVSPWNNCWRADCIIREQMYRSLFVVVLLSVVCFSSQCEDGWFATADPTKCYYIEPFTRKSWFDALLFCQAVPNAYLTSVTSAFEFNNIAGRYSSCWKSR